MNQDIRWKQRFDNFERSFLFLQKAVEQGKYDDLQAAGLVQSFEFTFELAWKTMKDYLDLMGITVLSPRQTLKEAFAAELINDGHIWIEMLNQRNILTHTYNKEQSTKAIEIIRTKYFAHIEQAYLKFGSLLQND